MDPLFLSFSLKAVLKNTDLRECLFSYLLKNICSSSCYHNIADFILLMQSLPLSTPAGEGGWMRTQICKT